jgi:hypothetical protein
LILPFFALIIGIVLAFALNLGISIVGLFLGLSLVLRAYDSVEVVTTTPLQLRTSRYLGNGAAFDTHCHNSGRYLYFFPWNSRTMSSMGKRFQLMSH